MNDFLNFNKMITPMVIKILFWVGVGFSVLSGLFIMFNGGASVILGLFVMVIGPLLTRVYCELLIVFFKVQESLHSLDHRVNQISEKIDK